MTWQNSSKVNSSFDWVFWPINTLCIRSKSAASSKYSPIDREISFNCSNLITPVSSLSQSFHTLCRPSLVLYSPIWVQTTSTNSSKVRFLFVYLRAQTILTTQGFRLSRPISSSTLTISCGSMMPLPSSSKIRKTSLSCSQSSGLRRSLQAVGTSFLVLVLEPLGLVMEFLTLTWEALTLPFI